MTGYAIPEEWLDLIPFPTEIVGGASALQRIRNAHETMPSSYAFLIGDEFSVDRFVDTFRPEYAQYRKLPDTILAKARELAPADLMRKWKENYDRRQNDLVSEKKNSASPSQAQAPVLIEPPFPNIPEVHCQDGFPRGLWPENIEPQQEVACDCLYDFYGNGFVAEALIGYAPIPFSEPWKLFAHTGFNYVWPAEYHVMIAKHWYENYGAKVVTHTHNVTEFEVDRPITNSHDALEMAKLHYAYCSSAIDNGENPTIDAHAAQLIGAKVWYFWWK